MDGTVVIGTVVDDKGFYDKIKQFKNAKVPDIQISPKLNTKELQSEIYKAVAEISKYKNAEILSSEELTKVQSFVQFIEKANDRIVELGGQRIIIPGLNDASEDVKDIEKNASKINLSGVKSELKSIGDSLESTIKKVVRWGLALIGIRSIYNGIRSAINLVSAQNEGISGQIDVMKTALANALLPVVQTIINALAKIMVYINYIYRIITGKNLFDFEKAFADVEKNSRKTSSNLGKANKKANDLRKTLAGFDEMNILNDNTTALGSGGGAGAGLNAKMPEIKNPFEGWENFKIPAWVEKIGKIVKFAADNWRDFAGMVTLAGVALGVITGNPAMAIISFIGYLLTQLPTLIDAIKLLTGSNSLLEASIKVIFATMHPFIGIPLMLADAFSDLTTETGSTANASINLRDAQEKLKKTQRELNTATSSYKTAVENAKNAEKELAKAEKETGLSGEALFKQVQNGSLSYLDMNDKQKRVYEAYLNNIDAQKQKEDATKKLTEAEKEEQTALKNVEKATIEDSLAKLRAKGDYEGYKKAVVDAYQKGAIPSAEKARDYIEQACQDMSKASAKTFTKDLPNDIKEGLNPQKYQTAFSKLKNAWNKFFNSLKTKLEITGTVKGASSGAVKSGFAKGGIVYNKLPKLAPGGIINQPGRGVPLGSAIGGERGAEGVIPLTDSQQMALLGEAIGKYITINANIVNTMNGRIISKELQRVQNESNFAYNK